jgi:glycosyltransferase involved in cell wall biosynthesis
MSAHNRETVISVVSPTGEGRLNGLTILRYAHASGDAGGLEQYLFNLNRALGERNQFATIQMELSQDQNQLDETTGNQGGCRLIKIPLFVEPGSLEESVSGKPAAAHEKLRSWLADYLLCAPPVYQVFTKHYLRRRRVPRQQGEPQGAGLKIRELTKRFKVNLIVLHSSGGADASEIIAEAERAGIPVALVQHFANDRLAGLSLRQQASSAAGVAGVYGKDVPDYLRSRFCNVSDGVDTEFFQADKAKPLPKDYSTPILLLPARITPAKGQIDLLKVASLLKKREVHTTVVLAGRVDSPAFENQLRQIAEREGLAGQIEFIGQLDAKQLRDWYAAARVLVFPTSHHEGLPRILMECQAMRLPPVVYDIGGTSEGLLDRQTGFLIPPGDVRRMADAVESLLKNNSLRAEMSQAGRRFVEKKFSLRSLAERHEDYYLKVLAANQNGAVAN